jgi:hypothetical protein
MDRPTQAEPSPIATPPAAVAPRRRKSRAQATVEFALVAPLMFTLALGIMEFGWLFRSHMTIHYATREGARSGAVRGNAGDAATESLRIISDTMATMGYEDLIHVRIYKAAEDGTCLPSPGNCLEDVYTRDATGWQNTTLAWPPILGGQGGRGDVEPTDALGVEIVFVHHFLINFLPGANGTATLTDHSVVQIEPREFAPTPTP